MKLQIAHTLFLQYTLMETIHKFVHTLQFVLEPILSKTMLYIVEISSMNLFSLYLRYVKDNRCEYRHIQEHLRGIPDTHEIENYRAKVGTKK